MIYNPEAELPCKHMTAQFFDIHVEKRMAAKCAGCPIIEQCRAYAYDNQILDGVWGGTTSQQRKLDFRQMCVKGCGNKARINHGTCFRCYETKTK